MPLRDGRRSHHQQKKRNNQGHHKTHYSPFKTIGWRTTALWRSCDELLFLRWTVALEEKLQTKLNYAGTAFSEPWIPSSDVRSFTNCTERCAVEVDGWKTEIRSVEGIDDFSTKLHGSVLCHSCQFVHREVDAMQIRADDYIATGISLGTRIRLGKCFLAEPFCWSPRARVRVADEIRPVIQLARSAGVQAQERCDRQTTLPSVNAT